jgi:hypothetical protein
MPSEMSRDEARSRIRKLLVTGDNRMKQGVDPAKIRETFEQALAVAREAGIEDAVRPLVEVRLADLQRLAEGPPPPSPPEA